MKRSVLSSLCMVLAASAAVAANPKADYPIQPVDLTAVSVADGFWSPRLKTNREVTVWYDFGKCEETGRIDNFAKAGGLMKGQFRGIFFDDSDVYKVIEGASYTLAQQPDPKLDKYLDDLIVKIAAAQEKDGYLYTARTLNPKNPPQGSGKERWSSLSSSHELYNLGHLYEAAVAHYRVTGKRTLLDVATKSANLLDSVFGPNGRHDVPGHEEVEIGLCKLYRATGEERYLKLAKFFLDQRGNARGHKLYGLYAQDHMPLLDQTEAVGHAVRAGYLYTGMADVAALTGDARYIRAIDRIWDDVTSRKLYITGGIGARHEGEAFGEAYELPNRTAYNETCAAIANALWNERMFLLHGDGKYIDVLERTTYNGMLAGISLEGNRFCYPNPLEADGKFKFNMGSAERQPWFGVSCCPVNIVRFIPSIAGFAYAQRDNDVYVNLFFGSETTLKQGDGKLKLRQETGYPWDGKVTVHVDPDAARQFTLRVRIPGWTADDPLPGGLYHFTDGKHGDVHLAVNGKPVDVKAEKGYAAITREWKPGDRVELVLPMDIRRVVARDEVEADRGRVTLVRGPLVYCAEGVDHGGHALDLWLADNATLKAETRSDLFGGVTVISGEAQRASRNARGAIESAPVKFTAVPYYAWNHRGVGEMAVWIARDADHARVRPAPTLSSRATASSSHLWQLDSFVALNDQQLPRRSNDPELSRFTWWDHRGSAEWVQYDFDQPTKVSKTRVYWFDDTGAGSCRAPQSWRLVYRDGKEWREVETKGKYGTELNRFNELEFKPVTTSALRIEVQLQPDVSAGILEWVVE